MYIVLCNAACTITVRIKWPLHSIACTYVCTHARALHVTYFVNKVRLHTPDAVHVCIL